MMVTPRDATKPIHIIDFMGPTGKGPACFIVRAATPMPAVSWPAVAGYVILYTGALRVDGY